MPSDCDDLISIIKQTLKSFSDEIANLIADEDWDSLNQVLEKRHYYLEQTFVDVPSADVRNQLKQLAELILVEDAEFKAKVEARRVDVLQQHLAYERGKKAVIAYMY